MKKIFLATLLAFFLIFTSTSLVQAQDSNFSQVQDRLRDLREERRQVLDAQREKLEQLREKRLELRERVATKQAEFRQKAVSRIKEVFTRILRRFDAALARLDKIAERIASRIDKLKSRGVDTSKAETALVDAEDLGAKAASAISDARAKINAIDAQSTSVRDAVHAARAAVVSTKQALFDYHKALVAVIRELKAAATLREGTSEAD